MSKKIKPVREVSKEFQYKQRLAAYEQKVQKLERDIRLMHFKYTAAEEALRHIAGSDSTDYYYITGIANDALEVIKNAKPESCKRFGNDT